MTVSGHDDSTINIVLVLLLLFESWGICYCFIFCSTLKISGCRPGLHLMMLTVCVYRWCIQMMYDCVWSVQLPGILDQMYIPPAKLSHLVKAWKYAFDTFRLLLGWKGIRFVKKKLCLLYGGGDSIGALRELVPVWIHLRHIFHNRSAILVPRLSWIPSVNWGCGVSRPGKSSHLEVLDSPLIRFCYMSITE